MKRYWKNIRVSFMYWRFRNITTRRMRLMSWVRRQRPASPYRERGTATRVYRHSSNRTWVLLVAMVLILTGLGYLGAHYSVNSMLIYVVSVAVVLGSLYLAIRAL